ncbi:MAG TPA: trigger factor [Bryobacteraceae bacterium]|nr:trigger factor [Bryobacteraceae bacterium]
MPLVEGCKHSLEISVPAQIVEEETNRVISDVQKHAKLRGFRPGKAPLSILRREYAGEIRQKVLESLVPTHFQKQLEAENLNAISSPDIKDIHLHEGEPLRFTAEFEVFPEIELKDYKDVEVPYHEPEVSAEDVEKRIEELREQKAQYVNVDPRPVAAGDFVVVALHSLAGVAEPVQQDEMMLEMGSADTLPAFSENLLGLSPGDEKEFDVTYPEDYGSPRVAGKTVKFHVTVKGLRRKDLPELNDEFAQDLGDYRNLEELREAIRKNLLGLRQREAQQEAKNKIMDKLVESHDFPAPRVFVERQIRIRIEQSARLMMEQGMDPSKMKLDWEKVGESQRPKAVHEVKASLLLGRIAEREAIHATREEVDQEVARVAAQERQPVAAIQMRFEKDGTLRRIADHIQTEKTLSFLFEHARKTAE